MSHLEGVTSMLQVSPVGGVIDWSTVYQAELPRVLNFFRYRVGDPSTAEDLTALTFEKAWSNRHRYDDRGKFASWLMTIARNVANDHFRSRKPTVELSEALNAVDRADPAAEVEKSEQRARLFSMLSKLPQRQQEIVALKYGAELTNREIAKQLGLTESNVGTLLHRLITQLRGEWEADR